LNDIGRIRVVSFDGDGTLWDFDKVMRHSLGCTWRELERLDPEAAKAVDIERMIRIRNDVAAKLRGRTANLEAIRLEAFRQTLVDVGRPDETLACHLNEVYLQHRFEDVELFSDALPTLRALHRAYAIGLLSNGNTYPRCVGLEEFFDFVVFSQDYGFEKPDPRIFEIALQQAGCSNRELVHVGDSLDTDVGGARNSGIASVWLNRTRLETTSTVRPDFEIASLLELPQLLQEVEG
jgi:putative hydrolase of the HAD superfamily